MNILIIILIVIGSLIALVFIAALFVPKNYSIEQETVVNVSRQKAFDYIRILKNADTYNKWTMIDPNVRKQAIGTDGTVGFIYTWESDNKQVGKGEQEITGITEGEKITYELRFIKPFEGKGQAYIQTSSVSDHQTKITWGMSSGMKYPMNIMVVLLNIKKVLANDLRESLGHLKNNLEKQ